MARVHPVASDARRGPWPKGLFVLALVQVLLLLPGMGAATGPVTNGRPRGTHGHTARLNNPHLVATVGKTAILRFSLDPPTTPPGSFVTVKLTPLQKPGAAADDPAMVLPGFPETSLRFDRPGIYQFAVVVSLVAKSSCGGVEMQTILEGEASVDVRP